MKDLAGKFIGFILAFFLAVIAIPVNRASQQEMLTRRQVVTEMNNFLDEVVDSKQYTPQMRKELVTRLNAYGVAMDFTVVKEQRSVDASINPDGALSVDTGTAVVRYIRVPMDDMGENDIIKFQTGDRVGIEAHNLTISTTQYLAHYLAGLFVPPFRYALYERVR